MIKDTSDEQIKVIFCESGKRARMLETDNNLGCFQKLVGGWIEEYMPFDDDVAIVCNEEGKTMGLPLNRGITDENGQLLDIIAGDFFICYAPVESESFLSMPPELEEKYLKKFEMPEMFFRDKDGIRAEKYEPMKPEPARDYAR
jgi:hypothetical protein